MGVSIDGPSIMTALAEVDGGEMGKSACADPFIGGDKTRTIVVERLTTNFEPIGDGAEFGLGDAAGFKPAHQHNIMLRIFRLEEE